MTNRYLPGQVLSRVERLELRARRIVEGWLVGRQASPYLGAATEFAGHRAYSQGDEVRRLDWKVYARSRRLVVKQFHEETHLPCWIVVDSSRSMAYGAAEAWSKYDHAATFAACLAHLLSEQQDAPGLAVRDSKQPRLVAPHAHPQQVARIAGQLELLEPQGEVDVIELAREALARWERRGLMVLVGDFLDGNERLAPLLRELRQRRQEVIVAQVLHGDELTFPFEGMTEFRGLEGASSLESDPTALRRTYLAELEKLLAEVERACRTCDAEYLRIDMREPLETCLTRFLGMRHGRG
mgnify:CR=1 FL=1